MNIQPPEGEFRQLTRIDNLDQVVERLREELPEGLALEERNPRKFLVVSMEEGAYGHRVRRSLGKVLLRSDGTLEVDLSGCAVEFEISEGERSAIRLEVERARARNALPESIPTTNAQVESLRERLRRGGEAPTLFVYRDLSGGKVLFVQQRLYFESGDKKHDVPWTFWSDGEWRNCEGVDGLLPLWGLERLRNATNVMLHEGAKAADYLTRMLTRSEPDASDWRRHHPLATELGRYVHIGWPGGAPNPHRVDWDPIRKLTEDVTVVMSCDNDHWGVEAAPKVSRLLRRPMDAIMFDEQFPEKFDLADPWPRRPKWWAGERYRGPRLSDLSKSVTWATEVVKGEKGRPGHRIRQQFAREWVMVTEPAVFVNRRHPKAMLSREAFNGKVRPYSEVDDTARLLAKVESSKVETVDYLPGTEEVVVTHQGRRLINTWRPSPIRAAESYAANDARPFLEFMEYLVPDQQDRHELMRWCATVVARPRTKIGYGVLLISETQGIGKGTLGEKILAPLVGMDNASFPTEQTLVDSQYTYWAAHKRLAVVNEIYAGQSWTAYNKLKSLITDGIIEVKKKFIGDYEIANSIHLFACSNDPRPLIVADKDRRWLIPRVTEEGRDHDYWVRLNRWLSEEGGLSVVMRWADEFLRENPANEILPGQHPPMTKAKADLIEQGRSEGERLAFDLAESAMEAAGRDPSKHAVLRLNEVRQWVARHRGLDLDDRRMEKELRLRKAMLGAGMREPPRGLDGKVKRLTVPGEASKVQVVATFALSDDDTWGGIKDRHKKPDEVLAF